MAKKAETIIHAAYGVLAVAITAGAASIWGETWVVAVSGAAASAGVILLCDLALDVARRHFAPVRQALDDRSFLEGVWMQLNVQASGGDHESRNKFGIFVLTYDPTIDTFTVEGTAYTADGSELARWASLDSFGLQVSANRRSANYDFKGGVTGSQATGGRRREGNTNLRFASDQESGQGTVVHVNLPDELDFDLQKVTKDWLKIVQEPSLRPDSLVNPNIRKRFAGDHASLLGSGGGTT